MDGGTVTCNFESGKLSCDISCAFVCVLCFALIPHIPIICSSSPGGTPLPSTRCSCKVQHFPDLTRQICSGKRLTDEMCPRGEHAMLVDNIVDVARHVENFEHRPRL